MSFVAAGITAAEVAAAIAAAEAAAAAAAEAAAVTAAETAAAAVPEAVATEAAVAVPEAVAESSVQEAAKDVGSEGIKDLAAEAPKSPEGGIRNLENAYRGDPKGLADSENISAELGQQRIADAERLAETQKLKGPLDLDAMGQPAAQPDLFSVAQPKPITPSTPTSAGNNPFSSMDAFNRNAVNNLNQGWKVGPSAPTAPGGIADAGGGATKDAWALALEDQGATAAQRTAMENSAKTFGDIGGKYESAMTKTPVERSFLDKAGEWAMDNKLNIALGGLGAMQMMPQGSGWTPEGMIRPYTYSEEDTSDQEADPRGRERISYSGRYSAGTPYKAAHGGLLSLHRGGNFLSGGGDGMSDDIPAMIGAKQPARLADGEFVIPADVVSHIGNGSSKAGATKLYAMMDKIRQERTGRKRQSPQINAAKYLPR